MSEDSPQSAAGQGHLASLDLLRAVACLAVCWHNLLWRDDFLPNGWLKRSSDYGSLGVEMFFVVSGFVIPWSLHRGGYLLCDYGRFILKRIARLDPPYLLSIVLVLALAYISTFSRLYHGKPFLIDWTQVLLHLGYLNVFFQDKPWLNTVYWTLAIEFEYYLLIGLLYPLLAHRSASVRRATLAVFVLSCFALPFKHHLPLFAPLFALGITAFHIKAGLVGRREGTVTTVLIALVLLAGNEPLYLLVGLASLAAILFVNRTNPAVSFFGRISYSLYLLHVPLGARVINLSLNWPRTFWMNVAVITAAFAVAIIAASLFHRFVERPSQNLSARIKYKSLSVNAPSA